PVFFALSLHDALPIYLCFCKWPFSQSRTWYRVWPNFHIAAHAFPQAHCRCAAAATEADAVVPIFRSGVRVRVGKADHQQAVGDLDRKSTRLNSSHVKI